MDKKESLAAFLFLLMMGLQFCISVHSKTYAEQRKTKGRAEQSSETRRKIALLNSLGSYPGTTLIRQYTRKDDWGDKVCRDYATDMSIDEAPTKVTIFYERKLSARGWKMVKPVHAAGSCYVKRNQAVWIIRSGPNDLELSPSDRLLGEETTPPASTRFFFAIETGPWRAIQ